MYGMGKIKTSVLAVGTVAVGLLTFRAVRSRRAARRAAEEEPVHEESLETAGEHASAAVDHARIAATKAIEARYNDRTETVEA